MVAVHMGCSQSYGRFLVVHSLGIYGLGVRELDNNFGNSDIFKIFAHTCFFHVATDPHGTLEATSLPWRQFGEQLCNMSSSLYSGLEP